MYKFSEVVLCVRESTAITASTSGWGICTALGTPSLNLQVSLPRVSWHNPPTAVTQPFPELLRRGLKAGQVLYGESFSAKDVWEPGSFQEENRSSSKWKTLIL